MGDNMPAQDFSINLSPKPAKNFTSSQPQTPPPPIENKENLDSTEKTPEQAPVVDELYGHLPLIPTMEAAEGIRFDFNDGLRVQFPEKGGPWHIIFRDIDTGVILYSQDVTNNVYVTSVKKFYVRFRL
ncbi:hypothetical protein IJT10_08100, partial [bacterium]|nr:hypothetical protein [bacterium]